VTGPEKALVAQFVQDLPAPPTLSQVHALARTLRRSKEAVLALIEQAKDNFQANADHYVTVHKQAVDAALANGDAKSLDVAVRGSQWALENLSSEGVSIVGKKSEVGSGAGRILIGIQIGGMRQEEVVKDAKVVVEGEDVP